MKNNLEDLDQKEISAYKYFRNIGEFNSAEEMVKCRESFLYKILNFFKGFNS